MMRSSAFRYHGGHAVRAGITALSLFAVTASGAVLISSLGAYAGGGDGGKTQAGDGNLGIFSSLFGDGSPSDSGGHGAFAMDPSGVRASFESLTQAQQARVMQRCRDVVAKPAQADPNQLALCQTVIAAAKR